MCAVLSPSTSNFYPRPPRGGRPEIDSYLEETKLISIHALREEGDVHGLEKALSQKISIHALREEGDAIVAEAIKSIKISIHALREEGDLQPQQGQ